MSKQLIVALSKGRILDETLPLLADAGIRPAEDLGKSRKLLFDTNLPDVKLVVIRATDVPTYVQLGAADLGVAGKDVLLEHGAEGLYEPLDLNIARCKLMTAGIQGAEPARARRRVATKFVNVARRYYAEQGIQAEVIKLYGAMELAPLMNLADEIVDIVDTGNTLRANGMEPRELMAHISTRLVVNQASMTIKHDQIKPLLRRLSDAVEARRQAAS
ncbi:MULTISPECIES: ATP phosphoribosyltransferase [Halomonas]|jgi:ATP phosphoribosyltransferase|uniref:ATP phosphoribosyltransferase n=3 Tax=Halomonas TaxID=2745 RepID=A0AAU7KLT4_9GAMM|nr:MULTISPECIES: ATP phosphoribosyltransferase [Halomonas]MBR9769634.1 ATP phosphoribosyltransferase [Gammaproteobacteria bacterium]KJZ12068.1 ATP phosphoribosyltransferase catalytic subunit [Halomonas sp. S2151]MAR71907.1 ATP phosphoribosyltransferase [Halomonas sp.]MBR9878883.1 ATP phosphoribosyltransferase [Gammaproteobacteria bacterium]MBS8268970.1 ATP phosphoribosyltransferase [Halomonas litopenaei]|tara:strand:+ start:650 stop:1300 length:651 start_codon:yes stop_codon:yes gene_type:complete